MAVQSATNLMVTLREAGLTLTVTPERSLKVVPASLLTPELRELISNAKPVLVAFLERDAANDTLPSAESWVAGAAMDDQEIVAFQSRLVRILGMGLDTDFAEQQAERMLRRDRDLDDRHLCLECAAFRCSGVWSCSNAVQAGLSKGSSHTKLAREFALLLQRCDGFFHADQEPAATLRNHWQDEVLQSDFSEWEEVGSV